MPDVETVKAALINKSYFEIIKYPLLNKQENLNYKITIVYGDKDIYLFNLNFVTIRYLAAKVLTIDDCWLLPWLQNPQVFNRILKNYYL